MKVVLLAHTPTPEQTVAAAARLCYSDTDVEALRESISQEKAEQFVEMLAGFGHESPVEHVTFTFGIEGVSRSFLAQVTRHRIASFSVQSQRYVRQDHFVFVTPPAIAADPELLKAYESAMQQSIDSYNQLADALAAKYVPEFLAQGCSEKAARTKAEKKAIEDARYVLPNACETKMILTSAASGTFSGCGAATGRSGRSGQLRRKCSGSAVKFLRRCSAPPVRPAIAADVPRAR